MQRQTTLSNLVTPVILVLFYKFPSEPPRLILTSLDFFSMYLALIFTFFFFFGLNSFTFLYFLLSPPSFLLYGVFKSPITPSDIGPLVLIYFFHVLSSTSYLFIFFNVHSTVTEFPHYVYVGSPARHVGPEQSNPFYQGQLLPLCHLPLSHTVGNDDCQLKF